MKTIQFHGILAKKFGDYFRLDVQSAREATHAIAMQNPDFKKFMLNAEIKGWRFAVFVGDENVGEDGIDDITSKETIHIVPRIIGAGGDIGGILQVVVGAVLVGVGVFASGLTMGASTALIGVGVGLMVGGATSLLMPTPDIENQDPDGNKASYGFGSAVTTIAQGNPVPLIYGEREIGGFVCSAAVYTEDSQ